MFIVNLLVRLHLEIASKINSLLLRNLDSNALADPIIGDPYGLLNQDLVLLESLRFMQRRYHVILLKISPSRKWTPITHFMLIRANSRLLSVDSFGHSFVPSSQDVKKLLNATPVLNLNQLFVLLDFLAVSRSLFHWKIAFWWHGHPVRSTCWLEFKCILLIPRSVILLVTMS